MTNPRRRAELQAQRDREWDERAREQSRKDALSMFMRIEEADASEDVKDILHRLAQAAGLEE
jgi:hypothetical protein